MKRTLASLLRASGVAALLFAAAWIRVPLTVMTLRSTLGIFVGFWLIFAILSLVIGLPLVLIIERLRIGRGWSYLITAAATGALVAAVCGRRPTGVVGNPHGGMVFSPWTRARPEMDAFPLSSNEYVCSIAFCAIVGGVLGLAFWYFRQRPSHPNYRLERP